MAQTNLLLLEKHGKGKTKKAEKKESFFFFFFEVGKNERRAKGGCLV